MAKPDTQSRQYLGLAKPSRKLLVMVGWIQDDKIKVTVYPVIGLETWKVVKADGVKVEYNAVCITMNGLTTYDDLRITNPLTTICEESEVGFHQGRSTIDELKELQDVVANMVAQQQ